MDITPAMSPFRSPPPAWLTEAELDALEDSIGGEHEEKDQTTGAQSNVRALHGAVIYDREQVPSMSEVPDTIIAVDMDGMDDPPTGPSGTVMPSRIAEVSESDIELAELGDDVHSEWLPPGHPISQNWLPAPRSAWMAPASSEPRPGAEQAQKLAPEPSPRRQEPPRQQQMPSVPFDQDCFGFPQEANAGLTPVNSARPPCAAEEELYSQNLWFYRLCDGEWQDGGLGEAKLLMHEETGQVRFVLQSDGSSEIVASCCVDKGRYCPAQVALGFGSAALAAEFEEAFAAALEASAVVPRDAHGNRSRHLRREHFKRKLSGFAGPLGRR